jgi:phenylacetate-CoA ligase
MIIEVEVKKDWFNGDINRLDKISRQISGQIRDEVLVKPIVKLVEPGSLPQSEGKAVRVKELRAALN